MHSVKLDRAGLLAIVRENMAKHVSEFEEAVTDYKVLVLKIAKDNLSLAKTSDLAKISKMQAIPQKPASYEDSYKRAIRMLELSVESVIELEEEIFNQLVLDEWTWKRSFIASNSLYKTGAF